MLHQIKKVRNARNELRKKEHTKLKNAGNTKILESNFTKYLHPPHTNESIFTLHEQWATNKATSRGDAMRNRGFIPSHSNRDFSVIKTHEPNKITDKREKIF